MFQSPLGEVVKETLGLQTFGLEYQETVSIPSRGSCKGDRFYQRKMIMDVRPEFQSPLGEVVKET